MAEADDIPLPLLELSDNEWESQDTSTPTSIPSSSPSPPTSTSTSRPPSRSHTRDLELNPISTQHHWCGPIPTSKAERKTRIMQLRSYLSTSRYEEKSMDDIFSKEPTNGLYVCGAGAACGITQDQATQVLQQYGTINRIIMTGLSNFIFILYDDITSATHAHDALHQHIHPLFKRMTYVEYASQQQIDSVDGMNKLMLVNATSYHIICPDACYTLTSFLSHTYHSHPSFILPGLYIIHDFISSHEENMLHTYMNTRTWYEHKLRHVQHDGYVFDYKHNDVDEDKNVGDGTFPAEFGFVVDRISHVTTLIQHHDTSHTSFIPNQLTINRYQPGHGIPPHIDNRYAFTDVIVALSMLSTVVMDFTYAPNARSFNDPIMPDALPTRPPVPTSVLNNPAITKHPHSDKYMISIPLPPRSLLIMSGDARYAWTHGISPRRTDRIDGALVHRQMRISMTFRQLLKSHQPVKMDVNRTSTSTSPPSTSESTSTSTMTTEPSATEPSASTSTSTTNSAPSSSCVLS